MMFFKKAANLLSRIWRILVLIIVPTAFLPLIFQVNTKESRCAYMVLVMSIFWMTDAIPLAITALLPVILLPVLGILSTDEACYPYLQETNMLFIGSLIMAIAIENCNLHRRIALRVMLFVGTNPRWIMLGFMLTTMFLSTWICNTATTAMMMPIVDAVLAEIIDTKPDAIRLSDYEQGKENSHLLQESSDEKQEKKEPEKLPETTVVVSRMVCQPIEESYSKRLKQNEVLRKSLYISVAFAANIGGTATLTSAGPNLILKFVIEEFYNGVPPVDYASWLMFCLPGVVVTIILVWLIFQLIYFRSCSGGSMKESHTAKKMINTKYDELGRMSFHEGAVLFLFISLVALWMFRDPHFAKGWATLFGDIRPKDASAAFFIVILLFSIPCDPKKIGRCPTLLTWNVVQQRLPWGVVLLRGGGFSMAEGTNVSGLSRWIGHKFTSLSFLSAGGIIFVLSLLISFFTELVSNSATATIFLPIVAQLATDLRVNPLFLLIPITLACSYAFMLPVGTPANAIVSAHANLSPYDLLIPGIVVKLLCIGTMLISLNSIGVSVFDLKTFPEWAFTGNIVDGSGANGTLLLNITSALH